MGINYEYVPAFTGGSASIQATMDGRADISFHEDNSQHTPHISQM